jgi:hypothetical protein
LDDLHLLTLIIDVLFNHFLNNAEVFTLAILELEEVRILLLDRTFKSVALGNITNIVFVSVHDQLIGVLFFLFLF